MPAKCQGWAASKYSREYVTTILHEESELPKFQPRVGKGGSKVGWRAVPPHSHDAQVRMYM